ncbi:MAG: P-loop NTPase [Candidatus Ranarchaeia archaeon]|jgi:ATP-binding protein involved in chromosome partitioning
MADPRINIIYQRLAEIQKIIGVCSGKGGVGKSMVASALALTLSQQGYNVGMLDIDFTSPSTHVILDAGDEYPEECKGLIPPTVRDIQYMSMVYFSRNSPIPLRGVNSSNALIELLVITRWSALDFLIIDMPPGIGDLTLDIIRLIKDIHFLIVTVPSKLALETVRKVIQLLKEQNKKIMGLIENIKIPDARYIHSQRQYGIPLLGVIAFDPDLEASIGNVHQFSQTQFMNAISEIVSENAVITQM